jgi:hypothetical protein
MAIEPWYYNGNYYPASAEAPHVFNYPDEEVPNHKWYPLDKKAHAALIKLRDSVSTPAPAREALTKLYAKLPDNDPAKAALKTQLDALSAVAAPFIIHDLVEDPTVLSCLPVAEKIKKYVPEDEASVLPVILQGPKRQADTFSEIQKRPSDVEPG